MSDMPGPSLDSRLLCANNTAQTGPCEYFGSLACNRCYMVSYCSEHCKEAHLPIHVGDCKSHYMDRLWTPSGIIEGRIPQRPGLEQFVGLYSRPTVCDNVPAFDIIRLKDNEGEEFQGPMNLLFAASGDMRSAILSIVNLPRNYRGSINIVLNDNNITVVARNLICLLVFFLEEDPTQAAEHVIHIWYSTLLTESCHTMLLHKVRPMIQQVCAQTTTDASNSALMSRTFQFGERSLRVELTSGNWMRLLSHCNVPHGLTGGSAQDLRRKTNAEERNDIMDMGMWLQSPSHRLGTSKYRSEGIMLPFSQSRRDFKVPNPTLFHFSLSWEINVPWKISTRWKMDDGYPLSGWLPKSFLAVDIGPAKNDIFGKLYHYLRQLFVDFHCQLRSFPMRFVFLHDDACNLPDAVGGEYFDRIDVNTLCDVGYHGLDDVLGTFGPLLQPPTVNEHATLVNYFLRAVSLRENVVNSMINMSPAVTVPRHVILEREESMDRALYYMLEPDPNYENDTRWLARRDAAMSILGDTERFFEEHMATCDLYGAASDASGLRMKYTNTIIPPWPTRMSGDIPTEEFKEEMEQLITSVHTGSERVVEWKVARLVDVQHIVM